MIAVAVIVFPHYFLLHGLLVAAQDIANQPASNESNPPAIQSPRDEAQKLLRGYFDNILELQDTYGRDLVTVEDATARYPILSKSSFSCPLLYDKVPQTQTQCFTPIITIYDRISNDLEHLHEQSIPLPEVLLISSFDAPHEMDLTGPSSIYSAINLLLDCAYCESLSPWVPHNQTDEAIACRQRLKSRGIDDPIRKWLARLVVTRKIVAVPVADVAGFYNRLVYELSDGSSDIQQYDNGSCDFPYPVHWSETGNSEQSRHCMSTYPARIVNELFHSHVFQLGVAFHGSRSALVGRIEIPTWSENFTEKSPDSEAMMQIASAMSSFGAGSDMQPYEVASLNLTSNSNSNECTGVMMEEFAFVTGFRGAGSELGGQIQLEQCSCDSSDTEESCDYQSTRTSMYDTPSLRSFIVRVVAPDAFGMDTDCLAGFSSIGNTNCDHSTDQYLLTDSSNVGMNVRMSFVATDLALPWTSVHSVAGVSLRDDIVPKSPRLAETCTHTKAMKLPESSSINNVAVTWSVGGALTVDETTLLYGEWSMLDKKVFNCAARPTKQELDAFFSILRDIEQMEGETEEQMETEVTFTPVQSGRTRWHSSSQQQGSDDIIQPERTFSVTLDLSRYKVGDLVAVYAIGRVDQQWVHVRSEDNLPGVMAQSNIVNTRTNPEWMLYLKDFAIKGQLDFFSIPVTIEIEDRPGFFEGSALTESSVRLSDAIITEEEEVANGMIVYAICMAILTAVVVFLCVFCREQSDGTDVFSVLSARRKIMHVSC
jgi:hypothetical protein